MFHNKNVMDLFPQQYITRALSVSHKMKKKPERKKKKWNFNQDTQLIFKHINSRRILSWKKSIATEENFAFLRPDISYRFHSGTFMPIEIKCIRMYRFLRARVSICRNWIDRNEHKGMLILYSWKSAISEY